MRDALRIVLAVFLVLCFANTTRAKTANAHQQSALEQVAFIHGGTGPFAVAGYRIGERALKELNLPRESFSLEVIHKTPNEVQWSCIVDGVQAATGASAGKLNLKMEVASKDSVETISRNKKSGQTLVFRLSPEFVKRYLDLPHEKLAEAGKEVLSLPDEQIFSFRVVQEGQ
jgi:formylmethanofuran dehydrogenase subunit E